MAQLSRIKRAGVNKVDVILYVYISTKKIFHYRIRKLK